MLANHADQLLEHGERVSQALRQADGVTLTAAGHGQLSAAGLHARFQFDPSHWIRIEADVDERPDAVEAMQLNHFLPGSLRYAQAARGIQVLADTQLDGEHHLAHSIAEIRRGLTHVHARSEQPRPGAASPTAPGEPGGAAVDAVAVEAALRRLKWAEDSVVAREGGWEVRPHFHGAAVPVQLDIRAGYLWAHRTVLPTVPPAPRSTAIADQALRFNAELRLARLALTADNQVVAEVRLHAGLIQPYWLATAVQAVAVASRHTAETLQVLAEHEDVAQWYAKLYLSASA